jgi:hypothetical protein
MHEPARVGRALALIEAELRADDPKLTSMFDAFSRHSPAPGVEPPTGGANMKLPAGRLLAALLATLIAVTMAAALSGSRQAAGGAPGCVLPAAFGHPPVVRTVGCPHAGHVPLRRRGPEPMHTRQPASSGNSSALAPLGRAYADLAGFGQRTAVAVERWAARQGQVIKAEICHSIPLPGEDACQ